MSFDAEVRTVRIHCPYCGERIALVVDAPAGPQQYVEDWSVCCRPMEIRVGMDAEGTLRIVIYDINIYSVKMSKRKKKATKNVVNK